MQARSLLRDSFGSRKPASGIWRRRRFVTRAVIRDEKETRGPRKENVPGNFFVDHTCIDCDTCRWLAPDVFTRQGNQSAVTAQPVDPETRKEALQALFACPTFSIHAQSTEPGELQDAQRAFPIEVKGVPGAFHCGYHDEKSFGATSYVLVRPQGNILIDSPRYNPALAKRLEEMGGIKWIFLTHRDDVGDHAKWAKKFGAKRIIHKEETNEKQGTVDCEIQFSDGHQWFLDDGSKDVEFLWTPGHSRGSICMYHRPTKTFFTGDHIGFSARVDRLSLFPQYGWDVEEQILSVGKLMEYDFYHILPGHGRRIHFKNAEDRLQKINECLVYGREHY
ncbi:hypothetical protein BSKO_09740 [Bryopsis sp. KO-2023]|nr:hypothetical protein BSKO_09740 [Bryopsis sp. KO-2023]